MARIIGVLVALVLVGAGVYLLVTSSPDFRSAARGLQTFFNYTLSPYGSTSTVPSGSRVATGTPSGAASGGGGGGGTGTAAQNVNPRDIPLGYAAKDLSPFFKKVRITSVVAGSTTTPSIVSLGYSGTTGATVNVSRWFLLANRGSQFIPQAIRAYTTPNAAESDIAMKNGDTLRIYSNGSPIGRNMLTNKCIGYLNREFQFSPTFPEMCPAVNRTDIVRYTGICQDYINSLGSCQKPAADPPVPNDDYGCRAYLRTLNYQSCVDAHKGDKDFLGNEWRVWTNHKFLDTRHDRVLLIDSKGLIVDEYIY